MEAGRLNDPHGVAADGEGRLVVADRENDRVQVRAQWSKWSNGLTSGRNGEII